MPKKTTILIMVLIILTAGLIYIAVRTEQQTPPEITEETLTEEELTDLIPTINPQTQISFNPAILNTIDNPQSEYTVDVVVNTNGQAISGIQLELSYDPAILSNVTVTPSENNLFGTNSAVLINSVDQELGRISYAIALGGLNDDEVTGNGNIASITFNANTALVQSTQISILPKTTVRSLRSTNSLLQSALPLNIIFSTSSAQTGVSPTLAPQNLPLQ